MPEPSDLREQCEALVKSWTTIVTRPSRGSDYNGHDDGIEFCRDALRAALDSVAAPEEPREAFRPAEATDVIAEVERRLRDTDWSSEAEDRCRVALMHIDAWNAGTARAPTD